jgi:hypothetical protein
VFKLDKLEVGTLDMLVLLIFRIIARIMIDLEMKPNLLIALYDYRWEEECKHL